MKLRWPWQWPWRKQHAQGNGHAAAAARAQSERKLREQQRRWPEIIAARDEFARLVEQAMRGHR